MVSFAFVPIFEAVAFAALWRMRLGAEERRVLPWRRALTSFLDGNHPWLLWLIMAGAIFAIVPPRSLGPWILLVGLSTIVPIVASIRVDLRFFRMTLARSRAGAIADVVIFRAIAWTLGLGYFLGIAIWAEIGL